MFSKLLKLGEVNSLNGRCWVQRTPELNEKQHRAPTSSNFKFWIPAVGHCIEDRVDGVIKIVSLSDGGSVQPSLDSSK